MPEQKTIARARADRKAGKSASTQAGEFVREQIDHIRQGQHGARSAKQAIAIGLSEARRAGVKLPPPRAGNTSAKTQKQAARDSAKGSRSGGIAAPKVSAKRSRATENALKRESAAAASTAALSRQAREAAGRRSKSDRTTSALKAVRTKGQRIHRASARKRGRSADAHA